MNRWLALAFKAPWVRSVVRLLALVVIVTAGTTIGEKVVEADGGSLDKVTITYWKQGDKIYSQKVAFNGTVPFDAGTKYSVLVWRTGGSSRWDFEVIPPGAQEPIVKDGAGSFMVFQDRDEQGWWWARVDGGTWFKWEMEAVAPVPRTLTMDINNTIGGFTSPARGWHTYDDGSIVSISATANGGWRFVRWDGDADCDDGQVRMDGNRTCTAVFELIPTPTHTLSMEVVPSGSGTTSPAAGAHTYDEGTAVNISATAAEGWRFVRWDGDSDCDDGQVRMDGGRRCIAVFELIPPTPAVGLALYGVSDNSGAANTSSPGTDKTSFLPGDTVRVTLRADNTGDTTDVTVTLNIRNPDGSTLLYDSHDSSTTDSRGLEDNTYDSPLTNSEGYDYYSFDKIIPIDAASGQYDIGGAIRNQAWTILWDTTAPSRADADWDNFWLHDPFKVVTHFSVTVSGTIRYEDREFDSMGYTGNTWKPVRYATVELLNQSDSVLDVSYTDESGNYSFSAVSVPVGEQMRVKVRAETEAGEVHDQGLLRSAGSIYEHMSEAVSVLTEGTRTIDDDIGIADSAAAWNILDMLIVGYKFALSWMSEPSEREALKGVDAVWEPGDVDGVYYNRLNNNIYIGQSGSVDAGFHDHDILHEYGHRITEVAGTLDSIFDNWPWNWDTQHSWDTPSPGGAEMAWAEGFAQFFSMAATDDSPSVVSGVGVPPGIKVRPLLSWTYVRSVEDGSTNHASDVEGAVAGVLWDLYDTVADDGDTYNASDGRTKLFKLFDEDLGGFLDAPDVSDLRVAWISRYGDGTSIAPIFDHHVPDIFDYHLVTSSTNGGSVWIPGEGTLPYDAPTIVDLLAVPDPGYEFVNWTGDVGRISDVTDPTATITVDGDYSIAANFTSVTYGLTVTSTVGGSVTTPGEGSFSHNPGTVVKLRASHDEFYRFDHWVGDVPPGVERNNTLDLVIDSDRAVMAHFATIRCVYNVNEGGAIDRDEAVAAVADYLLARADNTQDETIRVVTAFLLGQTFICP